MKAGTHFARRGLALLLFAGFVAGAADSPRSSSGGDKRPPITSPVDGDWQGTLIAGEQKLRLMLHIRTITVNKPEVRLDSPDQGVTGLATVNTSFDGVTLKFEVPAIHSSYEGKLNNGQNTITGVWTQGQPLSLDFRRISKPRAIGFRSHSR